MATLRSPLLSVGTLGAPCCFWSRLSHLLPSCLGAAVVVNELAVVGRRSHLPGDLAGNRRHKMDEEIFLLTQFHMHTLFHFHFPALWPWGEIFFFPPCESSCFEKTVRSFSWETVGGV